MMKITLNNRLLPNLCLNCRDGLLKTTLLNRQCSVTTWSALATAFNTRPNPKINLSLLREDTGLFMKQELQSHEGFYILKERAVNESESLIKEVISSGRKRKLVEIFDELSDSLCKVADLSEFIRIAHPKAAFAHAAEDACISISCIVEKLNTHYELYSTLNKVVMKGDIFPTTSIDDHVARLFMFDFEQCGIHLPEAQRQRVVELNDYILQLGQRFMNGAVQPRSVPKNILPENIRQYFSVEGDNIIVSGLYADSSNAAAREAAYKLFLHPNSHQEYLLSEMLQARQELAKICGFETYAHRALKASTIETPEAVTDFLNILSDKLSLRANEDFSTMQLMKASENPSGKELATWDTPYFTQKIKKQWLQVGASEFSPYFSLGGCMEGLDILMQSLFGIKLVIEEMAPGEAWANDIYKLKIVHESEGLLGYIYCDFYERNGKPNQDCHFTIQGGKQKPNGSYQNPIVVVVLNLAPPHWSSPTLLSPAMVDNLFHEMGHAMHSMLARTKYQHVTGTRCSTDFAEVPSVLMEYFASDPRVVSSFARHFQTQEKMPQAMLERLCASKSLFGASEMQLQVFYSALDQHYHSSEFSGVTTEALKKIQKKYYGLPYVANTAWQLRFGHLVGYGAKYYSYLVSRAVASLIWQVYFEADPFSRPQGEAYRRECLAHGGGKPSKQLVSDFLKRDLTPECMADALINEIDMKKIQIDKIRFVNELQ